VQYAAQRRRRAESHVSVPLFNQRRSRLVVFQNGDCRNGVAY
jgi:hypothetical protein